MNESVGTENNMEPPIREELVQTAIKFLQNPNVLNTPLEQKQKFLQKKGLSQKEVQLACERSGAYDNQNKQQMMQQSVVPMPYPPQQLAPLSTFDKIKEIVHNIALVSIVAYAIYKFYEKFIKPFLFGDKKKTIEETVEDLSKQVNSCVIDLKEGLASVKTEVDKINQISESNTQRQLQQLQSDVATVKGLLLSRKQFPSVANSPVVPPSIPAWQLGSVSTQEEQADQDPKSDGSELIELGSGSTPSEPEQETKNSDSSLEIM
ncbi:peroxisomal membrane protein PEX14 [Onthophagus taurus]|uniref:peroxisomal membrane protein PEX14 n=1 Tax=Onthophagus taurus TaxID=166361 RepID=UPI000C20E475|nr:peroxisomal membrane protein PEX14 [Onthophagus taurus]